MNKAQQIALGKLCQLPADHDLMRMALTDPEAVAQAESVQLEKADVFSLTVEGDSFFEYKEVWAVMDNFVQALRGYGIDIQGKDFRPLLVRGKSAMDLAFDLEMVEHLFTPMIWQGQLKEMDDAWWATDNWIGPKKKIDYAKLRETVGEQAGGTLRENQLKAMDLTEDAIRKAIKKGDFTEINQKMAPHGDHLRREDIFLPDVIGDHMLDSKDAWTHFKELCDELARHGERLEVDDFLFRFGQRKSLIRHAQDHHCLPQLFNPELWRGRTFEMLKVFNFIPEPERAAAKIETALDELANYDYGRQTDFDHIDRQALTKIMNGFDRGREDFHAIRPLSLKCVWDRIADINKALIVKGEHITLDDLREISGLRDENCLSHAARFGLFAQVIEIARANHENLTIADLTTNDKSGKSIINHLIEKDQLAVVFQPRDWVGRGSELVQLWQAIPEKARDKLNFQDLMGRTNMLALRQRFAGSSPTL